MMSDDRTNVTEKKPSEIGVTVQAKPAASTTRQESLSESARRILGDPRTGVQVLAQNGFFCPR